MEESITDSIRSAAGCVNGDLKETVFRQFLRIVNSDILNRDKVDDFCCSAIFLAAAYQESTEDERKTLSQQITQELLIVPKLVEQIRLFWKRGQ